MNSTAMRPRYAWYWLLPAAFVVHDSEELFTLPAWIADNQTRLADLLRRVGMDPELLDLLPKTPAKAAGAIAILLIVFVLVTRAAKLAQGRGAWQLAYAVLLGGFFLHGFTHLAQAAYFRGYTPGVVTAAVIVIPASLYLYRRLQRERLLRPAVAVASALLGIALFLPGVLLAMTLGAKLAAF